MPEPTLDWSTAEVKDSTLSVQVDGDLPDGWEDTFNTTVKLLGGGSWGEIKLEEQKAEVSGLTPGTEEKLKHFLESVVQQANANHASDDDDEDEEDEKDEGEDGEDDEDSDDESDSDKEMAEQFRSFADDDDESDDEDSDTKARSKKKSESKDEDSDDEGEDESTK